MPNHRAGRIVACNANNALNTGCKEEAGMNRGSSYGILEEVQERPNITGHNSLSRVVWEECC